MKFIIDRNIKRSRQVNKQVGIAVEVHYLYYILQEFQYDKNTLRLQQTKVNGSNPYKVSIEKIGSLGEVGITFVWLW